MATKERQICVRLSNKTNEKLDLLIELKKASLADVVRNAIDFYHATLERELKYFLVDKKVIEMFVAGHSIAFIALELKVEEDIVNKAIRSNLKSGN
jgi:predicted DNA-binding protein